MAHCVQGKPHIYFHRFENGLGLWVVRKPKGMKGWHPLLKAANRHASHLNNTLKPLLEKRA